MCSKQVVVLEYRRLGPLMGHERAKYAAEARPDSWRPRKTGDTPTSLDEDGRTRLAIFDNLEQGRVWGLLAPYRPALYCRRTALRRYAAEEPTEPPTV